MGTISSQAETGNSLKYDDDSIDVIDIIGGSSHHDQKRRNKTTAIDDDYRKHKIYFPANSEKNMYDNLGDMYTNVYKVRRQHVAKATDSNTNTEVPFNFEYVQATPIAFNKEDDISASVSFEYSKDSSVKDKISTVPNITWTTYNG